MSKHKHNDYFFYPCPECSGWAVVQCDCGCPNCETELDCELCLGTGFDPEHVDIAAYQTAVIEHYKGKTSWAYMLPIRKGERERRCGRTNGVTIVSVLDFLRAERAASGKGGDDATT